MKLTKNEFIYSLPIDIHGLEGCNIVGGSARILMHRVQTKQMHAFHTAANEFGIPKFYAVIKRELWLYPTPDEAYNMSMRYTVLKEV
jgi:hypothetical protein